MSSDSRIAVIGASIAGVAAVEAARLAGYEGELHLYDALTAPPFDRPPLSKGVLTGAQELETIALKTEREWNELDVELLLGQRVHSVSADLTVAAGASSTTYDGIILATGTEPREAPFPISRSVRCHLLRTTDDALRLRAVLRSANNVVIIGGGFIGLEVASSIAALGKSCTVVEAADMPLRRAVGSEAAQFVVARHRAAGCEFRLASQVASIDQGSDGRAEVSFTDGDTIGADAVVLSIGVRPATDYLVGTGLDLSDGITTDAFCRTNVSRLYACGDSARTFSILYDRHLRIEHWTTAREQGAAAAENLVADLTGRPRTPFLHVPYVWSDQLDMKVQTVGRLLDGATTHVEHQDERSIVVAFRLEGELVGGAAINRARDAMRMRKLLSDALAQTSHTTYDVPA